MSEFNSRDGMNAIWLENQQISVRKDVQLPQAADDEVLIRMRVAGICATDLELVRGYYPYCGIPGHEFVGEVVAAPGHLEWLDKRVVGEINIACGTCEACTNNLPTHCANRRVLGMTNYQGVFGQYFVLPVRNLHLVPDEVPDEVAVFTEPLAAALEIQQQVVISPGDRVLVVGAGRLGQLIAQSLVLTGCDLSVVSRYPTQKALLVERGIRNLSEEEIMPRKFDIVIETTGRPGGFYLARKTTRPRGTIVLKSTFRGENKVNFSSIVVDELTLVGSRCGPFYPALQMLKEHRVDPSHLISARYNLLEGEQAFQAATQPGVLKVLLYPQEG